MSRETLERAFEPFYTTKPEGEGTGLGLATVYGIVQQAGGSVLLYSEEGLGTTVTMTFPAVDSAGNAIPAQIHEPRPAATGTVLLVEDEEALRDVTERILTRAGYRVLVAESGPQAMEVAAAEPGIDLLLTDVVMPQMSGQQVAERLRMARPDLRVLYMSGYAQPFVEAGVEAGAVNLVAKPFTARALTDRIAELLYEQPIS
jgi:CheY-like chemotaxis protein